MTLLSVRDLHVSFPGEHGTVLAVRGIDFDLERGQTLCLVGESGSGKSSIVMSIASVSPPEDGTIEQLGTPITGRLDAATRRRLRSGVQLVMQDPIGAMNPRLTIFDILAEPMRAAGRRSEEIEHRVVELMDLAGLPRRALDRFPAAFTGGQLQRVGIARALALEPRLVILDEPVSALDMSVQADILNLLVRLQRELGISYLIVAHDLSVVRWPSDRVSVMYRGTIVETGEAGRVFAEPAHPYTHALLSASPVPDPETEHARTCGAHRRTRPGRRRRVRLPGSVPAVSGARRRCARVVPSSPAAPASGS
ncbi:MAG: ATP-binding cassette domain-containing protein [Actinomyces sp.]|jgi:peptide/nickel transport system ATP-binding protein|nr:ATP-binding cassette domain-containing protein [Actinomyces sp.]MCI1642519.1 ATP-binding cassette domain-containing protein [Actinomyces sp.]MCI1663048.1 ATP-binding cassette domain-containing protein [Actinomyces sp.]MCI1691686.1 ATP-binding cassette domain-containing protein [Actinomyces sp.]